MGGALRTFLAKRHVENLIIASGVNAAEGVKRILKVTQKNKILKTMLTYNSMLAQIFKDPEQ